ncbi:MAG TPA: hypothetical protein VJU15_16175 [Gemmatimonadales bacterium]|nr:hypothetical protein [Gemmatimonadales bacterium]
MFAIVAGLAALASPHVLLALALCFAAGGVRLVASETRRLERAALAIGLAGLGIATWLMATIIGPLPATYSALGDGPIGDPAARMLMLFLLAPITVYLADWRLNPAAAALLGRVGGELLPAGVTLWQGIAMPLALILACIAMRRRRPDLVAVAVGAFGLWSGSLAGRIGGGAGLAARMVGQGDLARLIGIAGFLAVIAGSWRIQFVYTVLLTLLVLFSTIFDSLRPFRPTSAAASGPQE